MNPIGSRPIPASVVRQEEIRPKTRSYEKTRGGLEMERFAWPVAVVVIAVDAMSAFRRISGDSSTELKMTNKTNKGTRRALETDRVFWR